MRAKKTIKKSHRTLCPLLLTSTCSRSCHFSYAENSPVLKRKSPSKGAAEATWDRLNGSMSLHLEFLILNFQVQSWWLAERSVYWPNTHCIRTDSEGHSADRSNRYPNGEPIGELTREPNGELAREPIGRLTRSPTDEPTGEPADESKWINE